MARRCDKEIRKVRMGEIGWVIKRHTEIYATEEGFDIGFEGLVAKILAEFVERQGNPREQGWVAISGEVRLGCVFMVADDTTTAPAIDAGGALRPGQKHWPVF
jgi:hypothetical protein